MVTEVICRFATSTIQLNWGFVFPHPNSTVSPTAHPGILFDACQPKNGSSTCQLLESLQLPDFKATSVHAQRKLPGSTGTHRDSRSSPTRRAFHRGEFQCYQVASAGRVLMWP